MESIAAHPVLLLQDASEEALISLLSHRPQGTFDGMIRLTDDEPYPTLTTRPSSPGLLGSLDTFSIEILHLIFAMLDFKALSNTSKTCRRGAAVVKSLPQYRDMIQHAPSAIIALTRTRLLHQHPASILHAALVSTECVSCAQYGAYLFLPTCQRCCTYCLGNNVSLWVRPLAVVQAAFGLSTASVKTLPMMRTIPRAAGQYRLPYTRSRARARARRRPVRVVAVGSARGLALSEGLGRPDFRHVLGRKPRSSYEDEDAMDDFCGMASVPFPSLVPGSHVELGLWCLGCHAFRHVWAQDRGSYARNPQPLPWATRRRPGHHKATEEMIYNLEDMAYSRADFVLHVRKCLGAERIF